MSHSDPTIQFFPPVLKWLSLSFFIMIIAATAAISFASQSTSNVEDSSLENPDNSNANNQIAAPSATSSAKTGDPQEPLSSPDEAIEPTQEPNVEYQPTQTPNSSNSSPSPSSDSPEVKGSTSSCPDPSIKGVIYQGNKYYYAMGMQDYYRVGQYMGKKVVRVERWFCSESEAIKAGWQRASQDLLNIILK